MRSRRCRQGRGLRKLSLSNDFTSWEFFEKIENDPPTSHCTPGEKIEHEEKVNDECSGHADPPTMQEKVEAIEARPNYPQLDLLQPAVVPFAGAEQ